MVGKGENLPGESDTMLKCDSLKDILQTIQQLQRRLQDEGDTAQPLNDILLNKSMQALLKVHERVRPLETQSNEPVASHAANLLYEVKSSMFEMGESSRHVDELRRIFASPHFTALLQSHDQIASKDFEPELPEPEADESMFSSEEESMKVVRLVKGNEPLGATIARDDLTGNIVIARILKGGAADRSGLIHVNDTLVEVNKLPTRGKKPEEVIKLLADFRGPLTFRLIPGETSFYHQEEPEEQSSMYVRAKFNYNPETDRLIPCPQAGLKFRKNDVLQIVSRDDESWWQASLVEDGIHALNLSRSANRENSFHRSLSTGNADSRTTRAGLIPSLKLQMRRETLKRQASIRNFNNNAVKGSSASLTSRERRERKSAWNMLRQSFRRSNKRLNRSTTSLERSKSVDSKDIPPADPGTVTVYEEVVLLSPASNTPRENRYFRPIVLVGPQGVGRNELKDRLIDSNPTHYGVPVPHTSRAKLTEEEDGRDYHFVTRESMEYGIRENTFLEYGEYKGNLYGTSLDAVKEVTKNQQVCVLTPYPQALKVLRCSELKPFVIFIKPPSLHQMNDVSLKSSALIEKDVAPFSSEELQDLVTRGERMETSFGDYFDYIIINDGIDRAFSELKQVAFAVENEPQWVPKEWT